MPQAYNRLRVTIPACALALAICSFSLPDRACTIFVLTDTSRTLFCNNEDFSNPKTRIWFVPAGEKRFGCVYVGFDDGFAQGGMNTKGLASDWVMGTSEAWHPDPTLPVSAGNRQMLESCATVDDAILFFRTHRELVFYTSRILVADRSGASVIIGAKDGGLKIERSRQCRGFGYGEKTLNLMLGGEQPEPTLANGTRILRACLQKGQFATKYSNIFDLNSGDIFLFPFPDRDEPVKLNLSNELKKRAHYYDMPRIRDQMARAPQPLLVNMERNLLERYRPIPDKEPNVTARVRAIWQDVLKDTMRAGDYTPEAWIVASLNRKLADPIIKSLGRLNSLTLVDRNTDAGKRSYRYRIQFENMTLLQQFVFDTQGKVARCETEDIE